MIVEWLSAGCACMRQSAADVGETWVRSVTHCFQVLLHDVPCGLHHLEHHVVLDVLHKVQHALSEGERYGEPAHRSNGETEQISG